VRIVGGRWRGRALVPPPDEQVRPTTDKVREAWMSIVGAALPDARVLDLFAGSGALGLEALSRGARSVDFVEQAPASLKILRENAERLGARPHATVHRADALAFVARLAAHAYDLAFADPPYRTGAAPQLAELWLATPFATRLSVEHASNEPMPVGADTRRYGQTSVTFYRTENASR
jgi:16S rRNA (guanine966-N2)-methyltransferase